MSFPDAIALDICYSAADGFVGRRRAPFTRNKGNACPGAHLFGALLRVATHASCILLTRKQVASPRRPPDHTAAPGPRASDASA
jgi:hypothetical protein